MINSPSMPQYPKINLQLKEPPYQGWEFSERGYPIHTLLRCEEDQEWWPTELRFFFDLDNMLTIRINIPDKPMVSFMRYISLQNTILTVEHTINVLNAKNQERESRYYDQEAHLSNEWKALKKIKKALQKERDELLEQRAQLDKDRIAFKRSQEQPNGYVYFIQDTISGHVKIGKSKNPKARLSQLQTATTNPLKLLHTIECEDMDELETMFHSRFADCYIRGEWFAVEEQQIEELKNG